MDSAYQWIDHALDIIHKANWYRSVRAIAGASGPIITVDGQPVCNFASNDYLGLASHPRLKKAAIHAVNQYGTGATGSRLLTGHRPIHAQLEQAIADWKQTDAALVFSSGYLANVSTVAALVDQRDIIFADQYNHSSLKNGAKLSGAKVIEFEHANINDLNQKLKERRPNYRRCLITSDSVFSMDGDLCDLPELISSAYQYEAMLLIDEAHATGVLGKTGSGCVEHFGCVGQPLIQVGTLSKALGSLGGYVAGSQSLIDFLRNRGAGWIYTTGLSPSDTAAALAAVQLCQKHLAMNQRLWQNIQQFHSGWSKLQAAQSSTFSQVQLLPSDSAIACLTVQNPDQALQLSQRLLALGYFVPAIRPPTVPTSRLRISFMASHSAVQISQLLKALAQVLGQVPISPGSKWH